MPFPKSVMVNSLLIVTVTSLFEKAVFDTEATVPVALGVKLPDSYIELMKLHNGGDLAYSILHSSRVPDGEVEYY